MNIQNRVMTITALVLLAAFSILPMKAMASGYDSNMEGKGSGTMMDEGHMQMHKQYALDGYCPVAIHKGMYLKGNGHFVTEYKGKVYKFVKFEAQKAFLENPEMFLQDVGQKYHELKIKNDGSMPKGSY